MRKSSIVTIIVSVVLIIAGIIVCLVGKSMAKDQNYMLYPETEDGVSVLRRDFSADDINRISVSTSDTKISVTRGGDKSYIELRNFNANYYKLSEENKSISVSELEDFVSMFKFWENGFSFKGMRYIFFGGSENKDAKEIIINLADNDNVANLIITESNGSVDLSDLSFVGDITLTANDSCSVKADGLSAEGTVSVSSKNGTLISDKISAKSIYLSGEKINAEITSLECEVFKIESKSGTVDIKDVSCTKLSANCAGTSLGFDNFDVKESNIVSGTGDVKIVLAGSISDCSVDVTSKNDKIFVDGVQYTNNCSLAASTSNAALTITTESGYVSVSPNK